jgi:hypothetical protein
LLGKSYRLQNREAAIKALDERDLANFVLGHKEESVLNWQRLLQHLRADFAGHNQPIPQGKSTRFFGVAVGCTHNHTMNFSPCHHSTAPLQGTPHSARYESTGVSRDCPGRAERLHNTQV